jgi:hypothetical protein
MGCKPDVYIYITYNYTWDNPVGDLLTSYSEQVTKWDDPSSRPDNPTIKIQTYSTSSRGRGLVYKGSQNWGY